MKSPVSLRKRMLWRAGVGIAAVWLVLVVILYFQIAHEVEELQESQLTQAGKLLMNHLGTGPVSMDAQAGDDGLAYSLYDEGGRLLVSSLPQPLHTEKSGPGLYEQTVGGRRWLCLAVSSAGRTLVVAQPADFQRALGLEVATDLMLPIGLVLLLLLPVVSISLWVAVEPLRRFAQDLEQRAPGNLSPLSPPALQELQPVVDRLNALFAKVTDAVARERRFTGDAAHELRTPIAALQVQLEVATTSPRPEARARAAAQLQEGLDRLTRLVDQLLRLARIEDDRLLQLHAVDLPALARTEMDTAGLAGTVTVMEAADWQGDPELLRLVFRNLYDNARCYAGPDCVVNTTFDGDQVLVADNGPGVAPDWLTRLGERFARPPGQESTGSGLGLSIVSRIVALHGGVIHFANGHSGGFQVRFSLPRTS